MPWPTRAGGTLWRGSGYGEEGGGRGSNSPSKEAPVEAVCLPSVTPFFLSAAPLPARRRSIPRLPSTRESCKFETIVFPPLPGCHRDAPLFSKVVVVVISPSAAMCVADKFSFFPGLTTTTADFVSSDDRQTDSKRKTMCVPSGATPTSAGFRQNLQQNRQWGTSPI